MTTRFLEGRVAWVTGGASGMGRAMALALAEVGADVAVGSLLADEGAPWSLGLNNAVPHHQATSYPPRLAVMAVVSRSV